jgi:Asp-tRNA(Asn)/Glu-tRNA(Gln) amidotransferase C subunit
MDASSKKNSPLSSPLLIERVAKLSRLSLEGDDVSSLAIEFEQALELFDALKKEAGLESFEPLLGAFLSRETAGSDLGESSRCGLRPDEVVEPNPEVILKSAPDLEGRGFVVPSVLGTG